MKRICPKCGISISSWNLLGIDKCVSCNTEFEAVGGPGPQTHETPLSGIVINDLPNGGLRLPTQPPDAIASMEDGFAAFIKLRRDKTIERIGHEEDDDESEQDGQPD